jgi:hypothetical protein
VIETVRHYRPSVTWPDCPMRWGSSNMPSWTVHGWNAATAPTTPADCSPSHPGLLGIPKRPSWPRSPCFLERAHLGRGAGSVCRRVLMALGRTISSPGAGTRSPRRSLLQRWMFEAEVRGLAEGHEGSIAQVRPRCRCRRRRSETEQSPAGSVVAGERPFDRFRRGTNQAGGHGLGLSIAVPPAECRGRCFRLRERPVDRSDLLRCRRAILARVLASIVHEFGRETVDSLRRCRDDRGSASNPFQLQV